MIEIVLIADKNYFNHATTTINSILKNTKSPTEITCITTDVSLEEIMHIECIFENKNIHFQKFDDSMLKAIKTKNYVSHAAYIKLLLPEIFKEKDKIIFLDSDLILNDDIGKLWDQFDENYTLQAVWNPGYNYDNDVFGLAKEDATFNSGVMLMNLKKMRENDDSDKLFKFIDEKNHLTALNDQAAFNAIYAHVWGKIALKWNVQHQFFLKKAEEFKLNKKEKIALLKSPSIIHFNSNSKPWMFRNIHPFKKKFIMYYTEVNGKLIYQDISMTSFLKKLREALMMRKNKSL